MGKKEVATPAVANLKAPPVYKIIVIQFFVSVITAIGAFTLLDVVTAYSVFLGGLTSALPNGYFARKAFQYRGARNTPLIIKAFYAGETGKLVMTAVMFALIFAGISPLNELAVIIGFILTVVAGLIAAAWVNTARS